MPVLHREKPVRKYKRKQKNRFSFLLFSLWIPLTFFFLETVAHLFFFGFEFGIDTFLRTAASLAIGALISFIAQLFDRRVCWWLHTVIFAILGLIFSVHYVYNQSIHAFFSYQLLGLAGDVADFWRETLFAILLCIPKILLSFLPLGLFLYFGSRTPYPQKEERSVASAATASTAVVLVLALVITLLIAPSNLNSLLYIRNDLSRGIKDYGLVTATSVDLYQSLFGAPEEEIEAPPPEEVPQEQVTEYNITDIDFEYLIANEQDSEIKEMHEYFASAPATKKNEYTGMFEGKNLIFLSLEAFSYKALDPELTPTLYKMYTEGFKFNNFYAPLWGGSTATGEYANMTGNFYTLANCIERSGDTTQYYAYGNLFARAGYSTYGYHNHTYTYYGRDKSHPNFGFPNFTGIGNGMELPSSTWPRSDYEMAVVTGGDYTSDAPFMTYYMTVSGHANFTWAGNGMAAKHRYDLPESMQGYSENVKAYLATQIEAELCVTELCRQLEEAGQLENTVFAMCCDHLPYALTDEELSELYGLPAKDIRNNYDLYRNAFILWSPSMEEPVEVDTPCASYDMLPTIANLFGLEYDSRLITGKDILSDTEKIVLINTLGSGGSWNWITAEGSYSTVTGKFTPSDSCTLSAEQQSEYVSLTQKKVAAMRKYSFGILDNNYYSYIYK